MHLFVTGVVALIYSASSLAELYGPVFDEDVKKFRRGLNAADNKEVEETLVRIRWAGITDPRIYDPIVESLKTEKLATEKQKAYVQAIVFSGNAQYLPFLKDLVSKKVGKKASRITAKKYLKFFSDQQKIAEYMARGLSEAKTNEELWARRYENGLNYALDREKFRWAARDLYLNARSDASFRVAEAFLKSKTNEEVSDEYEIDAIAFLCKALGLSRRPEYTDTLKALAENTPVKKIFEYAERSVQYHEPDYKVSHTRFKTSNPRFKR